MLLLFTDLNTTDISSTISNKNGMLKDIVLFIRE